MMATLFHFPNSLSLSCYKPIFSSKPKQLLNWKIHEYPPRRNFKIYALSVKRPRNSRKVMSDEELCNEVREFVAAVGLPEGHVPSMKELSQHGRNDLANIVRRRGYKLLTKLLTSSSESNIAGFNLEETVVRKDYVTSESEVEGLNQNGENEGEDVSSPTESSSVSIEENYSWSLNANPDLNLDDPNLKPTESLAMSLEEKVANFVQNGDLDSIEYNILLNESRGEESKEGVETKNEVTIQSRSSNQEPLEHSHGTALNESTTVAMQVASPVAMNHLSSSHDKMEDKTLKDDDLREDLKSETSRRDNQTEINHLKFMLSQKELELSRLNEQIEKEKIALSALQTKAETEIDNAQKLVSEKEAELHAAAESLSGLEEVKIEYYGDGEIVEVAGSFNAWHHRIKMDPQPSSIQNPIESRKPRLWSTVLWLYPGEYEIKFIVDGKWKIDPQRKTTNRSGMYNNILHVDR